MHDAAPTSEHGASTHGAHAQHMPVGRKPAHGHVCTCMGACAAAISPAVAPAAGAHQPASLVTRLQPVLATQYFALHTDHLLPLANAPPHVL
ncbi:MAG TPA: hypothetical protein VF021_11785 [Longimicrobiales bacterium]